jgi:hypothetical protein
MKKHVLFLCLVFTAFFVSAAHAAHKPKPEMQKTADYSCNYYNDINGKYYCIETSASCTVAHAWYKESGSTASPVLIVLSKQPSSGVNDMFEGYTVLPGGSYLIVNVISNGCGSNITTYVRFM